MALIIGLGGSTKPALLRTAGGSGRVPGAATRSASTSHDLEGGKEIVGSSTTLAGSAGRPDDFLPLRASKGRAPAITEVVHGARVTITLLDQTTITFSNFL